MYVDIASTLWNWLKCFYLAHIHVLVYCCFDDYIIELELAYVSIAKICSFLFPFIPLVAFYSLGFLFSDIYQHVLVYARDICYGKNICITNLKK